MRYRSRSRNYDSSDRYKSRRSPDKYESSRSHKTKADHYNHPDDCRKRETSKHKKINERSRYDGRRDSDSEDKIIRKGETNFEKDYKSSKTSRYDHDESAHEKRSRKACDYTHSYRRNSVSSDTTDDSNKFRHIEDRSDQKKSYYKESKRSKMSRSVSSERRSNDRLKQEFKEKREKKNKKKSKKSEKEKTDRKKKKKQKHSSEDEKNIENKINQEVKSGIRKSMKNDSIEEIVSCNKDKIKVEPFKVKETSVLKTQLNFLKSSNVFTKDEWQKEASDNEIKKKNESSKGKKTQKQPLNDVNLEIRPVKEEKTIVKIKLCDEDKEDINKRKRPKSSKSKTTEKVRDTKEAKVDNEKLLQSKSKSCKKEHSHSKALIEKSRSSEQKDKKSREHRNITKLIDERKSDDYLSEDERLELPRTPTDAQFAGLFTRLPEESVSDTDIEDILPPILLDDKMNALLDNDPNGAQEAWDSEDDVLLNKKESIIAPKHRGILETLSVPWKLLIDEASLHNKNLFKNQIDQKKDIPNILKNIGVSYKLAGESLWGNIAENCPNIFLNNIPLIHQSIASQKVRRSTIFRERGVFAGALSARKDFYIRRVLYEATL